MSKSVFFALIFCLTVTRLHSQILTTQIGRMRFYNTLDSAKSAWITAFSRRCYCLLQLTDSTRSMPLKLDLDMDPNPADTPIYRLDYNILSGNYFVPFDSTAILNDSFAEPPGIYIKVRDSVINPEIIFRLLDYGIHHYPELKHYNQAGKIYDRAFVSRLLVQKPTLKLKHAMAYCKK